jgi:hypothetical protein
MPDTRGNRAERVVHPSKYRREHTSYILEFRSESYPEEVLNHASSLVNIGSFARNSGSGSSKYRAERVRISENGTFKWVWPYAA